MQFKYPELLWGLLLLLIPILIHLFQLRRFKKTPFTNVKFLKQVVSESRKSSTLKKWLLLISRMMIIAALVLAFAQPFFANDTALQEKETVFYLDDSFSMNAQIENGNLFQNTIQDFIKYAPTDTRFTLFTNKEVFKDVEISEIQNELLNINVSSEQLKIDEIILRGNTFFSKNTGTQKNLVLISDFQQRLGTISKTDPIDNLHIKYIKPYSSFIANTSLDSIFISNRTNENIELTAYLSTNTEEESIPVSLFDNDKLIAKTAAKFNGSKKTEVSFTLNAKETILGKITISDNGLSYDNEFYFNIDKNPKIKVLAIGNSPSGFLERIYTDDEFVFTNSTLDQLNYSNIENQDLVVLYEIENLPSSLVTALRTLTKNGGSFTLIPAVKGNNNSYNDLSSAHYATQYGNSSAQELSISEIKTGHPLFQNVFDKKVSNFQYPKVNEHFKISTKGPVAIALQNKDPYLAGDSNAYFFSAALNANNSNFLNSPLIVPSFYNMGVNSLKIPPLYANLGTDISVEIPLNLQHDDIIKVSSSVNEFIPQQRILPNKVRINFTENPKSAGIYKIVHNDSILRHISFNENRKESELLYSPLPENNNSTSISNFFLESQKNNAINEFWKWFAILALVFVIIETLLQRFLK